MPRWRSNGSASITCIGNGGSGSSSQGVIVHGAGTKISSSGGNIDITGNGGTVSGDYKFGFACYSSSEISTTNNANITIEGTGSDANGTESGGVAIVSPISSVNGNISITGNGGTGTGDFHYGVGIYNTISCTGTGDVTLNGNRGNSNSNGVHFGGGHINASNSTVLLNTNVGNIISGSASTDVFANTLSLTAISGNIGFSGNPFTFDATSLSTNSSSGNGPQYLSEANNVSVSSMSFGTGSVNTMAGIFNSPNTLTCDGALTIESGTTFNNNGTLNVNSGKTLTVDGVFTNNNILSGQGTVGGAADFTNPSGGVIAPGTSPGCMDISTNFSNSGKLQIELEDGVACTNYDQITVTGTATINGTIEVSFVGGVTPTTTTFTVLTATGTISGVPIITWPAGYTGTFSIVPGSPNEFQLSFSLLPVELTEFRAEPLNDNRVQLYWKTETELQNEGFEIQHSSNGADWQNIAFVDGQGTTLEEKSYSYIDNRPLPGMNYYRLKQMDFDGKYEYSKVVSVDFSNIQDLTYLRLYPNPANNLLNLEIQSRQNIESTIHIYNSLGQIVKQQRKFLKEGINNFNMDLTSLNAGIYHIEMYVGNEKMIQKFVVE